jgi:hypothetical protein
MLVQKNLARVAVQEKRKIGDRTPANHNLLLPEELPNLFLLPASRNGE